MKYKKTILNILYDEKASKEDINELNDFVLYIESIPFERKIATAQEN